jgi:PAS domain S-box-containing protein
VTGRGHPHIVNGRAVATNWIFRNVTSEKYVEELLLEDYSQYSGIFDYIPVAVMLSDSRGVILQANSIAGRMLGYTPAELRGMRIEDITHPDDVKISLEHHKKLMDGQLQGYTMEKRYKTRSGNYKWTEITGSLVKNSSGKPLYGIAHVKDISELKQFEELLGKLAEDLITVRGEYLFDRLSARLIELLRADYVFIVSIHRDGGARRLFLVLLRDKLKNIPDPEFSFPEDLLEELLAGNELVITGRLTRKGIKTSAFVKQNASDLVATPLHNDAGEVIGILGAMYKNATHNHSMITTLLRIAGVKISDQLQMLPVEQLQDDQQEITEPGKIASH